MIEEHNKIDTEVVILMATYNGERYIKKQLQSLLNQSFRNWKLVIRDDGSDDNTVFIINECIKGESRVIFTQNNTSKRGSCSNFSYLFSWIQGRISFKYLMFSDQDDIWLPNKIFQSITALKNLEAYSKGPNMVYGKLTIIDNNDVALETTLAIRKKPSFGSTLSQNTIFGCTIMMNRQLFSLISSIPDDAENHDYWVSLVATAYDCVHYMDNDIIFYRQHDRNVTGGLKMRTLRSRYLRYFSKAKENRERIERKISMLKKFLQTYPEMPQKSKDVLSGYLYSFYQSKYLFFFYCLRHGIYNKGIVQAITSLIFPLMNYSQIRQTVDNNNKFIL